MILKHSLPWLAIMAMLSLTAPQLPADEVDDLFTQLRKELEVEILDLKKARDAQLEAIHQKFDTLIATSVKDGVMAAGKSEGSDAKLAEIITLKVQADFGQNIQSFYESISQDRSGQDPAYVMQYAQSAQSQYRSGSAVEARQALEQVGAIVKSESAVATLAKLNVALEQVGVKLKAENLALTKALVESQSAALLKAEKPTEVDPILDALNEAIRNAQQNRRSSDGNFSSQLGSALQEAQKWQDYLMYAGTNEGQALEALDQLLNRSRDGSFTMVPRSVILERKAKLVGVSRKDKSVDAGLLLEKAVEETRSLDQISALREKAVASGYNHNLRNEVETLAASYAALQRKDYDRALTSALEASRKPTLEALSTLIIVACLPEYLEAPVPAGTPDQSLTKTLDTMIAEAAQANRWSAVYRGLNLKRGLQRNYDQRDATLSDDITGVGALLSAYNFMRAGEWTKAVRMYQTSLEKTRTVEVVAFITPQLEAIRKDHPEEYQKAIAAPAPINPNNFPPNSAAARRAAQMGGPEADPSPVPDRLPAGPLKGEAPAKP